MRHLVIEELPCLKIADQSLPEIKNVRGSTALDELIEERYDRCVGFVEGDDARYPGRAPLSLRAMRASPAECESRLSRTRRNTLAPGA
jgi:hypothetical protein